jgi:hypothetical protein
VNFALYALIALLVGALFAPALAPAAPGAQVAQLAVPSGGKLPVPDTPGGSLNSPSERLPGERPPTEVNPPPAPVERIPEQIEPPGSGAGQGAAKELPAPTASDRELPDAGPSKAPAR